MAPSQTSRTICSDFPLSFLLKLKAAKSCHLNSRCRELMAAVLFHLSDIMTYHVILISNQATNTYFLIDHVFGHLIICFAVSWVLSNCLWWNPELGAVRALTKGAGNCSLCRTECNGKILKSSRQRCSIKVPL